MIPFQINQVIDPAIKDTDFQTHSSILNGDMQWSSVEPFCRQAIQKYIYPYISESVYLSLLVDEPNEEQSKYIFLLKDAIARYTVLLTASGMNLRISDMGVTQAGNREGTTQPVNQWRMGEFLRNQARQADYSLDHLLKWMEDYDGDLFDPWKESKEYQATATDLIKKPSDLSALVNFDQGRRVFAKLVPYIRQAEKTQLRRILGSTQYAALIDSLDTEDAILSELLDLCKGYVTNWALWEAIPRMTIYLEADGFKVASYNIELASKNATSFQIHQDNLDELRGSLKYAWQNFRHDIDTYLKKNYAAFPLWASHSGYEPDSDAGSSVICTDGGIML